MCATGAEHFRENSHFCENDNENGRNFAKINYFRMSFENFAKMIFRKFGNPNYCYREQMVLVAHLVRIDQLTSSTNYLLLQRADGAGGSPGGNRPAGVREGARDDAKCK